ncbi:hypothetical protein J1N10_05035 [Carboxylicivirga sp. A043]|uniref:hypothetical protein n=1 Tax=Carboxylicivirga litoralis TaxID=2816963 RepID=UPI0021CB236B|nr:hypothetical protein [Carboxylicivirga sp. A043]MCU4155328.1 hypothetical protein [Carboxylicivirga sp. A043]
MKKLSFFFLSLMVLVLASCNDDDDPVNPIDPDNIAGTITKDVEFDAATAYKLDGALIVAEGGSLTIPAGTKITAKGGSTSYIAVAQGGKIFVEGTASNPVVMTSDVSEAGSWGGLVICGKAPVNTGDGGVSEVGNLPYGGSDASDNSGSIEYLRVEYTGYVFTNEKQFNGVSFFGVGAGTTIDYVSSYMGNDDGIEFFGGTVNADHLVSIGSNDDGIDFADGWSGTGNYWYSLNSAKSGIEGSNNGTDGAATPMTTATINNITVYGMGEKPWFLKEGAGSQTIDNIVIGGLVAGKGQEYFYASSSDTDFDASKITITKAKFVDMGIGNTVKAVEGVSITEDETATGAGNGIDMPTWADGWAAPGAVKPMDPSTNIAGEYSDDQVLAAGKTYTLNGAMVIKEGGSLTIEAGATIIAKAASTTYIAISQGAKIFVEGTEDAPVVMTCEEKVAGKWGGLVVCGKAPINTGAGSISEVGNLPYGGDVTDDDSGSIEYLRVEYTGYVFTDEKQFNGVSFFGVGSKTKVSYLSSYMGNDDGIEFFGGTVNADHLVSIGSNDDGIDFADGWSGTGNYWYAYDSAKSGIEGSNNGTDGAATPMTTATINNVTVYKMGEKPWFLKEGAGKQTIDNVVIGGLVAAKEQAYFYTSSDDTDATARIAANDIKITNAKFVDVSANQPKAVDGLTFTENADATGAGNGKDMPDWAAMWAQPAE